jgi:hypothetical protein
LYRCRTTSIPARTTAWKRRVLSRQFTLALPHPPRGGGLLAFAPEFPNLRTGAKARKPLGQAQWGEIGVVSRVLIVVHAQGNSGEIKAFGQGVVRPLEERRFLTIATACENTVTWTEFVSGEMSRYIPASDKTIAPIGCSIFFFELSPNFRGILEPTP